MHFFTGMDFSSEKASNFKKNFVKIISRNSFYFEGGVFPNRFLDTEAPLGVVGWADLVCPWDLNLKKNILNSCIWFFS